MFCAVDVAENVRHSREGLEWNFALDLDGREDCCEIGVGAYLDPVFEGEMKNLFGDLAGALRGNLGRLRTSALGTQRNCERA